MTTAGPRSRTGAACRGEAPAIEPENGGGIEIERRRRGAMPRRRLGFAVKVVGESGLPSHDTRRWQSKPHLSVSLERLRRVLDYLARMEIGMYRLPSAVVPYGTHPELPQFHGQIEDCAEQLAELGAYAKELDVRLSSHPGQYVVLNSASQQVREAAARDLELQSRLFDAMGLGPEAVVVLHVGSGEGGHEAGKMRFLRAVEGLSERARARLVIENDDRVFALKHVLEIAQQTGLRVVWDVLHHHCNDPDGLSDREALGLALDTWPAEQTPKIHYSSPKTVTETRVLKHGRDLVLPQLRAHADMVDPVAFEWFLEGPARGLEFDIMLEAKAKDAALLRLREQLSRRGIPTRGRDLHTP
jgi:UV DNA damage endonuclease